MTEYNKIDNRRLKEDSLYEKIEEGLIVRRVELKSQKKVKLATAEYTFLQFHSLIFKWALGNHNLTKPELNALLYTFPLITFTLKQFQEAQVEMGAKNPNVFFNLKRKGHIVLWSKSGRNAYYVLSSKATTLINRMHRMFMLEEQIPISPRRNVFANRDKNKNKDLMDLFKKFNNKVKNK
jgi:hypothetical protein